MAGARQARSAEPPRSPPPRSPRPPAGSPHQGKGKKFIFPGGQVARTGENPSVEELGVGPGKKTWIRPTQGSKRSEAWIEIENQAVLEFVCSEWATDCQTFMVEQRGEDEDSPNTKPPNKAILDGVTDVPRSIKGLLEAAATNSLDPVTYDDVSDMDNSQKVKLWDKKLCLVVNADALLEYLKSQARERSLLEIELTTMDNDVIHFTGDLWFSCLLRKHPSAKLFRQFFAEKIGAVQARCKALRQLKSDEKLVERLYKYVDDLLAYSTMDVQRQELVDEGLKNYFSAGEEVFLTSFPAGTGASMQELLDRLVTEAIDEDGGICTAHALAPFFMKFFQLVPVLNDSQEKLIDAFYRIRRAWK